MIEPLKTLSSQTKIDKILNRNQFEFNDVNDSVTHILKSVKEKKDEALFEFTKQFDNVALNAFKVDQKTIDQAFERVDSGLLSALENATKNIEQFHQKQTPKSFDIQENNALVAQRFRPIENVGLYIPGGSAAYPSTVLMNAIPAKIAGVKRIVMVTPPQKDGTVKDSLLVAAKLSGVDEIYMIGGAQAVAALTFGTQSIPKVDKIVGPGNIYVAIAKRMVSGYVGIDMIAGPSEITIIADETSDPAYVAADMLSQAEHDEYAAAIVLINDEQTAKLIQSELTKQTKAQPRKAIIEKSLKNFGAILVTDSLEESVNLANKIAPEHLEILTKDAQKVSESIHNAGAIFIGPYSPEPLGDYYAGPNHTLPTSATARFSSALSTTDFIKSTSIIHYSQQALQNVAQDVITIAEEEGLNAHASAVMKRLNKEA